MRIKIEMDVTSEQYAAIMAALTLQANRPTAPVTVALPPKTEATVVSSDELSFESLQEMMQHAAKSKGVPFVTKALSSLGVRRLADVAKEDYPKLAAELKAA